MNAETPEGIGRTRTGCMTEKSLAGSGGEKQGRGRRKREGERRRRRRREGGRWNARLPDSQIA
jgi:hypothetical protein